MADAPERVAMRDDRRVLVTYAAPPEQRRILMEELGGAARVEFLGDAPDEQRADRLAAAEVLLSWNWNRELSARELEATTNVRFVQLLSAGTDHFPFDRAPSSAAVAGNVGAYAGPMAEHVVAMVLALAKRLPQNHSGLARGEFPRFAFTRSLDGTVCGILGFGGIGRATARLMRPFGVRVHAVNTSGTTTEPVEFVGTLADLDRVLAASDVVVVALPLTEATRGLIGGRELGLMKADAILVNVARGAIVDEAALYEHLRSHPDFSAGIDTWWSEPGHGAAFRTDRPFFDLPNLLGSPHNSALVPGVLEEAARKAARNVLRFLRDEAVTGLARREDHVA